MREQRVGFNQPCTVEKRLHVRYPLPPQKGSGCSVRRRAGVVPRGAPASRFDSAQLTTTTGGVSGASPVERADDSERAAVDDVRVDHGGPDVLVAEECLDGPDVGARFEEVGREAV